MKNSTWVAAWNESPAASATHRVLADTEARTTNDSSNTITNAAPIAQRSGA